MWTKDYNEFNEKREAIIEKYGKETKVLSVKINSVLLGDFQERMAEIEKRFREQTGRRQRVFQSHVLDVMMHDLLIHDDAANPKMEFEQTLLFGDPVDEQAMEQFEEVLKEARRWANSSSMYSNDDQRDVLKRLERAASSLELPPKKMEESDVLIAKLRARLNLRERPLTEEEELERTIASSNRSISLWISQHGSVDEMPKNLQFMYNDCIEKKAKAEKRLAMIRQKD